MKTMSLKYAVQLLNEIPDEFIGMKIKQLLTWQVTKGQSVMYRFGWYLRAVVRDWGLERHQLVKQTEREKWLTDSKLDALVQKVLTWK